MASTTFVDQSTPIVAAWLNDVNTSVYTTVPAVQTSLSTLTATVSTLTSSVQDSSLVTLTSVSGTNTITASLTGLTAYGVGKTFRFVSAGANTGAVTININGLGAKAITKSGTTALTAGDIASGAVVQITYDGTQFQLVSGAGAGGAVADGTLYLAKTQILNDYTIPAGNNALSVGGISVASGKTLTVPSGQAVVAVGIAGNAGTPDQWVNVGGPQNISGVKNFTAAPTFNGLDMTGLGVNQTWQNVSASRTVGTTYYNTTGKPILLSFASRTNAAAFSIAVNGVTVCDMQNNSSAITGSVPIPPGASYSISGAVTASVWAELR